MWPLSHQGLDPDNWGLEASQSCGLDFILRLHTIKTSSGNLGKKGNVLERCGKALRTKEELEKQVWQKAEGRHLWASRRQGPLKFCLCNESSSTPSLQQLKSLRSSKCLIRTWLWLEICKKSCSTEIRLLYENMGWGWGGFLGWWWAQRSRHLVPWGLAVWPLPVLSPFHLQPPITRGYLCRLHRRSPTLSSPISQYYSFWKGIYFLFLLSGTCWETGFLFSFPHSLLHWSLLPCDSPVPPTRGWVPLPAPRV